jgi:glycosyltransferase involved in cell wall biosynthesis
MKPHILWYGDSPTASSGFGNVSAGIIGELHSKYDFTVFGINYDGFPHEHPFRIVPAFSRMDPGDLYGKKPFLKLLEDGGRQYDLVFMMQDSFILSHRFEDNTLFIERVAQVCKERNIALVVYFPIDAIPFADWLKPLTCADVAVTYTNWGQEACAKICPELKTIVIPHGTSPDVFFPLPGAAKKAIRHNYFSPHGEQDLDTFTALYVGQNQRRKIIDWVLIVWAEFLRKLGSEARRRSPLLLLHTQPKGHAGWDIARMIRSLGFDKADVKLTSANGKSISQSELNEYYNLADCLILPSAEGWGLPATEAMCAGCLTVLGNHASLAEIGSHDRSFLVDCPRDPNFIRIDTRDNEVLRRRPDVNEGVKILLELYSKQYIEHEENVRQNALKWARSISWQVIASVWDEIFSHQIERRRENPVSIAMGRD